ncbi:MAG: MarR family winged helix-turn-helix transcriptional regulator [Candidatus Dactylopiibacterium sp.]|nr:MarR family winged helix-turn-helix transcriptional regulator [Candidatus Dactylopiibacterium sp.]
MRKKVDKVNQSGDAAGGPEALFEAMHALMHLHRARVARSLRESGQALTHMEAKVLAFFARHPGATQSVLVSASGRDKAQLARLVRDLKAKGLLEVRANAADGRSQCLHLTAAGQACHDDLEGLWQEASQQGAQGLSGEERAQLLALLARVRANLGGY